MNLYCFKKINKNSTPLGLLYETLFYLPVAPGAIQFQALRAYTTKQFFSSFCTGSYSNSSPSGLYNKTIFFIFLRRELFNFKLFGLLFCKRRNPFH